MVAQQLGLGFVTAVDPTQNQQGMLVGNFLAVLGVTLIFATDMHHLIIAALNDSYKIFAPGEMPLVTLEEMEKRMIRRALRETQDNLTMASERLGIHRNTLRRKIAEYGIEH